MKKIMFVLMFAFLASFAYAIPAYHQFYGSVMNESNNLIDAGVSAKINGVVFGSGASLSGLYGYSPLFLVEDGVNGDVISFYVDGYFSVNYTFLNEGTTELNLTLDLDSEFTCIDSDLDGYNVSGSICGVVDCNDSEVNVHPGRSEDCSTNYDDNCDGSVNEGCVVDNPPGNGGGSSYSGTSTPRTCTENWTCGDWNDCASEEQLRICADKNNCNTTLIKPEITQVCEEPITGGEPAGRNETGGIIESVFFNWGYALIAVAGLIIIILVLISVVIISKREKNKPFSRNHFVKARGFVSVARKKGYSDEKIRKMFLDKGWKEKDINKIL